MSRDPRVVSIAPGSPFLTTLVRSFLDGTLLGTAIAPGDPLALADATIYVPTRRAARALRSSFVETMPAASAILPRIRPLGDFDEEADFFTDGAPDALALPPPLGGADRILLLARLIRAWRERIPDEIEARIGERLVMPTSSADAVWFARDLADLIDEVETEGTDWALLDDLADEDVAQWWQVTRRFLDIVTDAWPDILSERQRSSPAGFRREMILAEARRLEAAQPAAPVIAAGSTGSIPATARLLSVISRLPNGCVVLPGLDKQLDDVSFGMLDSDRGEPAVFGHPQFGLARLLATIGCRREQVTEIGAPESALAARGRFMSEALRPADTTDAWAAQPGLRGELIAAGALDGMSYIEAANEREEAEAIALVLRNAIEVITLAKGRISLEDICRFVLEAPQSPEQVGDERWRTGSYTAQCIAEADAKPKTAREQHDCEVSIRYWLGSWPNLADRTRSSIVATWESVGDLLLHGIAHELVCTETNWLPELSFKGAITILDLPLQRFHETGRIVQGILKYTWQRAVLARDVTQEPRPVFLWIDEAQGHISAFDYEYQSTARSARACTVYLSQSITNYHAKLGSGAQANADALLGLFQTTIFHANSDAASSGASSARGPRLRMART